MMYYYNDYYNFFPFHILGMLFSVIFWVLIIYGIVYLFKRSRHTDFWHMKSNAEEILKERYAKGEITKEKFEEMKKDLK